MLPCSCPCVRTINVASVQVHVLGGVNVASVLVHVLEWLMLPLYVYVLGGGGGSLLPLFMSMYMC